VTRDLDLQNFGLELDNVNMNHAVRYLGQRQSSS